MQPTAPTAPPPADLVPVRRALLSVSDKTGLADFARALVDEFGVELISTGGTAKFLRDNGLAVTDVADLTGFPEMMDGRVKTLHPAVHGALLGRLPQDAAVMAEHGIGPIDLVCVNLYPFEATVAREGASYEEAIENIDIGGPAMIRSAAKNHARVAVVVDPERYPQVLDDLRSNAGATSRHRRAVLAAVAFGRSSGYDAHIWIYLNDSLRDSSGHSEAEDGGSCEVDAASVGDSDLWLTNLVKRQDLRYGENPHQSAALYGYAFSARRTPTGSSIAFAEQSHGKALSYINLLDADAALKCVSEFDADETAAVAVVKHATPCGVGRGESLREAFEAAYAGDPLAAFGGIVASNRAVDVDTAAAMAVGTKFLEVIAAPSFEPDAVVLLAQRWKNVRLLSVGPVKAAALDDTDYHADSVTFHQILGGLLIQQRDLVGVVESEWKVVSRRQPTPAELAAMKFNWLVAKHVKSNAVVIGGETGTYGIGGGQVDRVAAARHAVEKAGERARGAVAASDAFFPFPDGPELLLSAGITAIVQPGGSVKDQLTIDAVDAAGAAMVFTGRRHFRH